ncbi:MAG: fibronectin type III domain-containing protein [Planctomycetaceae bacterium]|nr:fibronectin type III domain-containing protein [Planctomycetaceae bacterium]
MPFLNADDSHTSLHEPPPPFSEVSAEVSAPFEHNFAPQAGPLPGGLPPASAQARDLEVYNDIMSRPGTADYNVEWTAGGYIRQIAAYNRNIPGTLDVSGLTALTTLRLQNNQLTEINASNNPALTVIELQNNQLTEINVSNNPALTRIDLYINQLTALDVSNNTALTALTVSNNQLTFSTLKLPTGNAFTTLNLGTQGGIPIVLEANNVVDLSSEHGSNVGGTTTYTWHYADGDTVVNPSLYTENNGVFTFIGLPQDTEIYAVMTNTGYENISASTPTGQYMTVTTASVRTAVPLTGVTIDNTSPKYGDVLTATPVPANATVTYQWQYYDSIGDRWENVSHSPSRPGTNATYTVGPEVINRLVRVIVTDTTFGGEPIPSAPTNVVPRIPITGVLLANIYGVPLTAAPRVGDIIFAQCPTEVSGLGASAFGNFVWQRQIDGGNTWEDIPDAAGGARYSTYEVTFDDIGYAIRAIVTIQDTLVSDHFTGNAISDPSGVVRALELTGITIDKTSPQVGDRLTAALEPSEPEGGIADFQWQRQLGDGAWTNIAGETNATYTVAAGDLGYALRVIVSGDGTHYNGSETSDPTAVVTTPLIGISIDNTTPEVGDLLTATLDPAVGTANFKWQHRTGGTWTDIADATDATYTVAVSDVGYGLRVVATGTGLYTGNAESDLTNLVPAIALAGVSIDKASPEVGDTITATLDPAAGTADFQWQQRIGGTWTNIADATDATYTVAEGDLGYALRVVATGTGAYSGTETSSATATVTAPLTGISANIEQPKIGDTLTVTVEPDGATVVYAWFRDGTLIDGVTGSSYEVTEDDAEAYLQVVAVGTGNYTGEMKHIWTSSVPRMPDLPTVLEDITLDDLSPKVGDVLTARLYPSGSNADYQWQRQADGGDAWVDIEDATGTSYTVTDEDIGYALRVSATGRAGYFGTVESDATNVVPIPPTPLTGITVSTESPKVGDTITVTPDPADATVVYAWFRGNEPIDGATGNTYVVTEDYIGQFLRVVAVGTGEYSGTASYTWTEPVTLKLTGNISVSTDEPKVGDNIVVTFVPDDENATFKYQWYRGGRPIDGATENEYTATEDDLGERLSIVITGDGDYGGEVSYIWDDPVAPAGERIELTGNISVSTDEPKVGDTIVVTFVPDDENATFKYQWYRGGRLIDGATESKYTATGDDLGEKLSIVITGNGNYGGEVSYIWDNPVAPAGELIELTGISVNISDPKIHDMLVVTLEPEDATATYMWFRGEDVISGATGSSYLVTDADVGAYLRVVAMGIGNYTGEMKHTWTTSVPFPPAEPVELEGITLDDLSPKVGDVLTARLYPVGSNADYQWQRQADGGAWENIASATGTSYTATVDDIGSALRVTATGRADTGYFGTVESEATNVVPVPPTPLNGLTVDREEPKVGDTIAVMLDPSDATATYMWFRDGILIPGATGSTYTVIHDDTGHYLRVVAVGTGAYSGTANYTWTNLVTIELTGKLSVSTDEPKVGDTITATFESDDENATFKYQWYRGGRPIDGATENEYTATEDDLGEELSVVITGDGNYTGEVSHTWENLVEPAPIELVGEMSVDNENPRVGDTITVTFVPDDEDALFDYQWYRGGQPIDGATENEYTATEDDLGEKLSVVITGNGRYIGNLAYTCENPVEPALIELTGNISVNNENPKVGDTIVVTFVPDDENATFNYQWHRGGLPIDGAAGSEYRVTEDDLGENLSIVITGNGGYTGDLSYAWIVAVEPADPITVIVETEAISASEIRVSWNEIEQAEKYIVTYSTTENFEPLYTTVIITDSTTTLMLSRLLPEMVYHIIVQAVVEGREDSSSPHALQATLPEEIPPQGIVISNETSTSMVLSWSAVANAVGYEIEYSLNAGRSWVIGNTSNTTSITINNLAAGMNYMFRLRTVFSDSKSDWSDSVIGRTNPSANADVAAHPRRVTVAKKDMKPTTTAIILNITPRSGNAASHIVSCVSNPQLNFSYRIEENRIVIEGLQPRTKYRFAVQAVDEHGNISKIVNVRATTATYKAVKSLKAPKASITANSVTLTWNPSTARTETIGYIIEVWDASGKNRLDIVVPPITDVSVTTITISALEAGTRYTFVVKATDGVFESVARKIRVSTMR